MFVKDLILKIMDLCAVIPDEPYLKFLYFIRMKKPLHLNPPRSFNEKQQWLKINNHSPEYHKMVDKLLVRDYILEKVGKDIQIPLLGVWDNAEDINFDELPEQFVLKCTHDSGSFIICTDKSSFDRKAAVNKLNKALKRNFYISKREWPYKDLKGRIIAEQYMEDEMEDGTPSGKPLSDYKLFCFNGVPRLVLTIRGGHLDEGQVLRRFYDDKWNLLPVGLRGKAPVTEPEEKPQQLEEMLELAAKLSEGIPFLRVDFYIINGKVYFGELTFFHMSGCEQFTPESYDMTFGDMLKLS